MEKGKGMHRTTNKKTTGIYASLEKHDALYPYVRFLLFEMDKPYNSVHFNRLMDIYGTFQIDVLVHNTGGGGLHFMSPTLIKLDAWKAIHKLVLDINKRWPPNCLRTKPNKYVDENLVWYKHSAYYYSKTPDISNSQQMCNLINHWFGTHFKGLVDTDVKMRDYWIK